MKPKGQRPSEDVRERPEYRPTPEQRQRAMRELHSSPYFTGWTSQESLLKDWGNWKGERPK
jgi:hypothetical protein